MPDPSSVVSPTLVEKLAQSMEALALVCAPDAHQAAAEALRAAAARIRELEERLSEREKPESPDLCANCGGPRSEHGVGGGYNMTGRAFTSAAHHESEVNDG